MKFILILTLMSNDSLYTSYSGIAMQSFNSKEACYKAGYQWINKMQKSRAPSLLEMDRFFLCVEQ